MRYIGWPQAETITAVKAKAHKVRSSGTSVPFKKKFAVQ